MDIKKPKKLKARVSRLKKQKTKALKTRTKDYISGDKQLTTEPKRVTNKTMSKHRDEVLSGAKKFKYPLQHSKYRIAFISVGIIIAALLLFGAYSYSLLYKQQSIGDFAYRISKIVPIPVAKVGGSWISFEKYLFEVRQNAHYLINQENVDFETPEGQEALRELKEKSLGRIQENEIIRQLAAANSVVVTEEEVDAQLENIRETGGISQESKTLEDTLSDFYGWDINDLRRVIKDQLLKQKIVTVLDIEAHEKGESALQALESGKSFEEVAKEFSEDELTKEEGGLLGVVTKEDTNLPGEMIDAAFIIEDGKTTALIETPFGIHIIKRLETVSENEIKIAHVLVKWEEPSVFIDEYRKQVEIENFIEIN